VFAWGVDSTVYVIQYFSGTVGSPWIGWPLERVLVATGVLVTLLASCLAAERVAPTVGLPARFTQSSLPVSVVAAIVSGLLVWVLAIVMVLPIARAGRGLSPGDRMPCLPEQWLDVGRDRPALGCAFFLGNVEYFVATTHRSLTTVEYMETASPTFTTEEGISVGSPLRDVVKAGGSPPTLIGRGVCGSRLPSYWIARFDTNVCGGTEPRPDEVVRRLFKQ
jgi:hypothetical protein